MQIAFYYKRMSKSTLFDIGEGLVTAIISMENSNVFMKGETYETKCKKNISLTFSIGYVS